MKKFLLLLSVCLGVASYAAVQLPGLFSDHAVLARRNRVPVWGKAAPGERVTVLLGKKSASCVAGKDGKWLLRLDLADSPEGPFELRVNDKVVRDVLVGEVWLCSGQSNMEFRLNKALGAKEEIARTDRKLRNFHVPVNAQFSPQEEPAGCWVVSGPETSGSFSAVSYFFGRKLRDELDVPVGLIHSSCGGVPISTWLSKEALETVPEEAARQLVLRKEYKEYPQLAAKRLAERIAWEKRYDRADTPRYELPGKDAKWKKIPSLHTFSGKPGAVWFRYIFTLPALPETPQNVYVWRQNNSMDCFVNGTLVGRYTTANSIQRARFKPSVPVKLLKQGENELLFRVFSSGTNPEIDDTVTYLGKMLLDSNRWEVWCEKEFPALSEQMQKTYPEHLPSAPEPQSLGNTLYNGMIAPLRPFTLSGVLWYQGESDCSRSELYRKLFPALIRSWRRDFDDPALPFFYCQLPGFGDKLPEPQAEVRRASLRDAQDSALALPHTGSAVLIDQGEAGDIHPLEKKIPGNRLAALALTQVYGRKGVAQGPRFAACRLENGKLRIRFSSTGSGLIARPLPEKYPRKLLRREYGKLVPYLPGSPLQGFAVCGKDGRWHWAHAEIDGAEVVVTPPVEAVALRYAWEANPSCNLFNREGFPAAPFQCSLKP